MDKLPWIIKAGAPVLLMVLGGLIMYAGGYRGYEHLQNFLEYTGAVVTAAGILLFGYYMILAIRNMFKK
jgi:Na+/H+-dicarboxylate symporter